MFVLIAGSIIGPAMAGPTGPFATALLFPVALSRSQRRGLTVIHYINSVLIS